MSKCKNCVHEYEPHELPCTECKHEFVAKDKQPTPGEVWVETIGMNRTSGVLNCPIRRPTKGEHLCDGIACAQCRPMIAAAYDAALANLPSVEEYIRGGKICCTLPSDLGPAFGCDECKRRMKLAVSGYIKMCQGR